ncbi:hypothetical protein C8R42DRAFT_143932 [Lentinula raphanica]|nr:hypothetical protein C8R42DRAFT_143932 [Lentinula raphanica]
MPISISVRTISVALLLLSSAVDIVAAPVSTTGPSQMPSMQHDERRVTAKLHARVFARRLPGKGDNGKITKHDHRQLRPGETVSICLDHVALDVVREKPNAPNSPSNSNSPKSPNSPNSSKSPNSPNSPYSGHNFPKSEKWHIEPGRNRFDNADPQILYLGQIHYDDWESKKTLLGVDVLNKLGGKKGFLFTEVIETIDSEISPGRLESHETANLVIEKLRRWSNDPEVKMEFKEEEVVHSETKEKIKVGYK